MNSPTPREATAADYPHLRDDLLRLTDLDFQQHVNNATFTALLANARFAFLKESIRPHLPAGNGLVIARLEVDFKNEMLYDFPVRTGTRILGWGRTSLRLEQSIFQRDRCTARAVSVFVHMDAETRQAAAWPEGLSAKVGSAFPSTPSST